MNVMVLMDVAVEGQLNPAKGPSHASLSGTDVRDTACLDQEP